VLAGLAREDAQIERLVEWGLRLDPLLVRVELASLDVDRDVPFAIGSAARRPPVDLEVVRA
jgi:hypothetical protein